MDSRDSQNSGLIDVLTLGQGPEEISDTVNQCMAQLAETLSSKPPARTIEQCYQATPLTDECIRLLLLQRGARNDDIQCNIFQCPSDISLPYWALSYCWGDPSKTEKVYINGARFLARKNLSTALRQLRSPTIGRLLWTDAICINQKDETEKSEQIARMLSIYQNADRVMIWLGPSTPEYARAMDLLRRFYTNLTEQLLNNIWKAFLDIRQLFDHEYSWWQRTWILQEAAVAARPPLVGCGSDWLPWTAFHGFLRCIQALPMNLTGEPGDEDFVPLLGLKRSAAPAISVVGLRHDFVRIPEKLTLHKLLRRTRHCQATDGRDRIFALLGLASDARVLRLKPDYARIIASVYTETTRRIIEEEGSLTILALLCELVINYNRDLDLPSWVPNYASWDTAAYADEYHHSLMQNARAGSDARLEISFSDGGRILRLRGLVLDGIVDACFGPGEFSHIMKQHMQKPTSCSDRPRPKWRANPPLRGVDLFEDFFAIARRTRSDNDDDAFFDPTTESHSRQSELWVLQHKFTFVTEHGFAGLGACGVRKGDVCFVPFGSSVPFVLRPERSNALWRSRDPEYTLLGICTVPGVMEGQFMEFYNASTRKQGCLIPQWVSIR